MDTETGDQRCLILSSSHPPVPWASTFRLSSLAFLFFGLQKYPSIVMLASSLLFLKSLHTAPPQSWNQATVQYHHAQCKRGRKGGKFRRVRETAMSENKAFKGGGGYFADIYCCASSSLKQKGLLILFSYSVCELCSSLPHCICRLKAKCVPGPIFVFGVGIREVCTAHCFYLLPGLVLLSPWPWTNTIRTELGMILTVVEVEDIP